MSNPHAHAYKKRIAELEREVATLRATLEKCIIPLVWGDDQMLRMNLAHNTAREALQLVYTALYTTTPPPHLNSAKPLRDNRAIAVKIAALLFVNGLGKKVRRLMVSDESAYGWSEDVVADRIEEILEGEA